MSCALEPSASVLLSPDVVLGEVAALALAVGIVRLVPVLAVRRQLGLALPVVAVVAHVFRVVLFVPVWAHEDVVGVPENAVLQGQALEARNDSVLRIELLLSQIVLLESADRAGLKFLVQYLVKGSLNLFCLVLRFITLCN